jgi:diketogulonate reductase-like aldo/keto reductase
MSALHAGDPLPKLGLAPRASVPYSAEWREARAALQAGIDLGLTLLSTGPDTETLVGEAIVRRRDEVFVVARLAPWEATMNHMAAACTASLRRLTTDVIDLYLLHGRGDVPLEESAEAFETLRQGGLIRHWGVADYPLPALTELFLYTDRCAAEEIVYDLAHRGAEWDLLDACRDHGLPVLACCPLQSRGHPRLGELAARHQVTPAQLALAWVLSHEGIVAVPPVSTRAEVAEYHAALAIELDGHDHARLDEAFVPPLGPQPLERRPPALSVS